MQEILFWTRSIDCQLYDQVLCSGSLWPSEGGSVLSLALQKRTEASTEEHNSMLILTVLL